MKKAAATAADPTLDPLLGGGPGEPDDAPELAGREGAGEPADGEGGGEPAGKGKAKGKEQGDDEPPEIAELRRQLADERRARQESQEAAQYWSRKARGKRGQEDEQEPEEPEEVEDQDPEIPELDIVDLLSTKGLKGLDEVLTRIGYTKENKVNRAIRGEIKRTRAEITKESALYSEHPELRKPNTEFFKTTARIYRELIAEDKTLRKSPKTIEVAARLARAELGGSRERDQLREPELDERELPEDRELTRERESDRVRRVGAQQGDRARGKARSEEGDDDDLDATQRTIVRKFMAAGAPIDEERYKRRARQGIQVAGLPRR